MVKIICGSTEFNNKKYKFDFRDNILVLIPDELEDYSKWFFEHVNSIESNEKTNIKGITNNGKIIYFLSIKLIELGGGALQAFVPGFAICNVNTISPLPECNDIDKITFFGECIDRFYPPKQIINYPSFSEDEYKYEIDKDRNKLKKFKINKDEYSFGVRWESPISSDINVVLNVKSYLTIVFSKTINIEEIIDYYLKTKRFFSFLNNRKYIKFEKIIASKNIKINNDPLNPDSFENQDINFEIHIVDPDEIYDLNKNNYIILNDIKDKIEKLYSEVSDEKFLVDYYPLSTIDNSYIDNDKYVRVASAFESEMDKFMPNYKSESKKEYKYVKKSILNTIHIKRKFSNIKLKLITNNIKQKKYKNIIKECNFFSKKIGNMEGTLEEKILFIFNKYNDILEPFKNKLLQSYYIDNIKNGILANKFASRRNSVAHGYSFNSFEPLEIISYELLKIGIYCITFDRCGFKEEKIKELINKIFK